MLKDNKMKFKITENGNLSIIDDKKETIIHSDRYDLTVLMKTIQPFLLGEASENEEVEDKPKGCFYRYNTRSRRLEKVIE
jgi:hypothetical protein